MKYTFLFLISISFLSSVNCISVKQTGYSFFSFGTVYSFKELIGCTRKIMCVMDYYDRGIRFKWIDSELPADLPDGKSVMKNFTSCVFNYFQSTVQSIPSQKMIFGDENRFVDVFSCFGIVCDNGTWFATKYLHGISFPTGTDSHFTGPTDEYNEKKSKIEWFHW
ncbi:hypothetical protein CRE_06151 [Caenorhabditis remanei]|uniref:Uncharacterized protein n=1 Tax=Caenorhabditis remanei TaxID=31234 RepID=E3NGV6_CAERE|nr:hypothetical protein CRE_06151 [Caenorhabditis remanei]